MRIIKGIVYFFSTIGALIYWLFQNIKLESFKNYIHKKDREKPILVLGNGPSLSDDLKNFDVSEYDVCVVNFFANSDLFFQLKPKFYSLIDGVFFENTDERFMKLMENIKKADWEICVFVPYIYLKKAKSHLDSKTIKLIPVHKTSFLPWMKYDRLRFHMYRKNLATPSFNNVLVGSLYCLMNSGYSKIYLLGADHSWLGSIVVDENNVLCLIDSHFYDKTAVKKNPWYKTSTETFKVHEILATLSMTFEQYHIIEKYAEYLGNVLIVNVTKESFIDAFERYKK